MNAAGSALAWCAVQIALVGVATMGAYALVARLHQAAGGFAATTGLAVVFCLSAAASPWPRWSFLEERRPDADPDASQKRGVRSPLTAALSRAFGSQPSTPPVVAASGSVAASRTARRSAAGEDEAPRRIFAWTVLQRVQGAVWLDRRPRPDRWRWTGSLAVMFAVGMAVGMARLAAALSAAGTIRRRSQPVQDRRMLELLAALQAQLGCSQGVELRELGWLSAPATIGWRRPVILLPGDWRQWSDGERRAVLAHELAHVERGDYLLWLAAQMALVLHFYNPAVHWLAARIRLEQEFAADAAAAQAARFQPELGNEGNRRFRFVGSGEKAPWRPTGPPRIAWRRAAAIALAAAAPQLGSGGGVRFSRSARRQPPLFVRRLFRWRGQFKRITMKGNASLQTAPR